MSAKEMRKLLCEFINSILTDLDAGEQRTLRWGGEGGVRGLSEETGMIILNFCKALYKPACSRILFCWYVPNTMSYNVTLLEYCSIRGLVCNKTV